MNRDEALKLALEALEQTLKTLDDENAKPGGAIADTIWYSQHETLFDYLASEITALREALAQPEQEPPPWWPAVENILTEYGLQAIDFVADFKAALAQPEQEPVACLDCGSPNIGVAATYDSLINSVKTQPEQEPVGLIESLKDAQPCCGEYQTCWRACTPRGKFLAQRTWVGLTDKDVSEIIDAEIGFNSCWGPEEAFARAIEAKLKELNT